MVTCIEPGLLGEQVSGDLDQRDVSADQMLGRRPGKTPRVALSRPHRSPGIVMNLLIGLSFVDAIAAIATGPTVPETFRNPQRNPHNLRPIPCFALASLFGRSTASAATRSSPAAGSRTLRAVIWVTPA